MHTFKLICLILTVLLIQSCGPSSEGPSGSLSSHTPKFNSVKTQLYEDIEKYSLECNERSCPDFIGMLVTQQNKMRWRCTSFFIKDNIMATAAHCLPKELNRPGQSCKDKVYVVLEGRKKPLNCKKILQIEQLASGEFDYAFFEVESQAGPKFPISIQRQSRYNKQKVKIAKVNPLSDNIYKGQIDETKCELNNNSLISLYFNGPRTPQIQYSGCKTVSGNSGAPILNMSNQVIGIHHSSIKPNSPTSLALSRRTTNGKVDEFGSGTNFGCLCASGSSYRRCLYYQSCKSQNDKNYLLSSRQENLDRLSSGPKRLHGIDKISEAHSLVTDEKYFEWTSQILFQEVNNKKGQLLDLKLYLSARPKCLKNGWKFKDLPIKNNTLKFNDIGLCEIDYTLDSSLRPRSASSSKTTRCNQVDARFTLEDPNNLIIKASYETKSSLFATKRAIPYCD